jgi:hypothetical protein
MMKAFAFAALLSLAFAADCPGTDFASLSPIANQYAYCVAPAVGTDPLTNISTTAYPQACRTGCEGTIDTYFQCADKNDLWEEVILGDNTQLQMDGESEFVEKVKLANCAVPEGAPAAALFPIVAFVLTALTLVFM